MTAKVVFAAGEAGETDMYKLLSGLVVPRPIGWIGTIRTDGTYNLAPYSFFNLISTDPPIVIFSGGRRGDRPKDSVAFAEDTGGFTVNIVSEAVAEAMNVTSASFEAEIDEFAEAGLTPVMGTYVNAPMVAESPANLECRVIDAMDLPGNKSRLVFGQVVAVHVQPEILDGTRINSDQLRAVGRLAGNRYTHTRDRFDLGRPG